VLDGKRAVPAYAAVLPVGRSNHEIFGRDVHKGPCSQRNGHQDAWSWLIRASGMDDRDHRGGKQMNKEPWQLTALTRSKVLDFIVKIGVGLVVAFLSQGLFAALRTLEPFIS
jgi:hypothetical protein